MEKSETQILKEKLFRTKKNGWENIEENKKKKIFEFSKEYIDFINEAKT